MFTLASFSWQMTHIWMSGFPFLCREMSAHKGRIRGKSFTHYFLSSSGLQQHTKQQHTQTQGHHTCWAFHPFISITHDDPTADSQESQDSQDAREDPGPGRRTLCGEQKKPEHETCWIHSRCPHSFTTLCPDQWAHSQNKIVLEAIFI